MSGAGKLLSLLGMAASAAVVPGEVAAQARTLEEASAYRLEQLDRPAALGTAGMLGLNALLGGVSVGLVRELRGGSFLEGFVGGAVAGGVVFAGKSVAAQHFSGAGLAGRQLAAVGGSVASNVAAGAPALSRLELPFGPLRVVFTDRARNVFLRVDPIGVGVFAFAVLDPRFRLDAGATLSSGTPVFEGEGSTLTVPVSGAQAVGLELNSVILLADLSAYDAATREEILAHERVHTIQADAFQAFWGRALLEWIAPGSPGWQRAVQLVDLNLGELTAEVAVGLFARRGIWEIEAEHVGR